MSAQARAASTLAIAFLLSGAAGLVHEMVWTRLLGLLFGVTELAIATVLAAFMGGLAIGSWLVGGWRHPWLTGARLYAWLEIGIGLAALAIPVVLHFVEPAYGWLWRRTHLSFGTFSILRFFVAGGILLAPTIMMGATFPVLAAHLRALDARRASPQWLYTLNLVGAGLGVAAAGFVLLPAFGIRATLGIAALVNIGVGLWVLRMRDATVAVAPSAAVTPPRVALSPLLLAAAFFSGLASLATQVAWTRVLSLLVGSTTYAFTSVLLAYLAALALGGAWATWRAARTADVRAELALMHVVVAALMLIAIANVDDVPYLYLKLYDVWPPGSPGGSVARALATTIVLILAPVAAAGTLLPLALVALLPKALEATAPAVGRVYALNTLGAIVGAVLGGFYLVPVFGTQWTLTGIALAVAGMGVALALPRPRPVWLAPVAIGGAVVGAFVGLTLRGWDHRVLNVGVFEPGREAAAALQAGSTVHVDYQREGPSASVVVLRWDDPNPAEVIRGLLINARANASDAHADLGTQVILAQLPLLLARQHQRVLVVGWGSGVTVGSATQSPAGRIDAVELEPAVVEASHHFNHVNHRPLDDPRVRLHVDDARHILSASEQVYDVIISEPSHPWLAGVANLFTEDFYRLAAKRLAEDGIFAQWIQTYQISWDAYRSLLAAFRSVFPEVLLFRSPMLSSDTILIGSRRPLAIDVAELERRWQDPRVQADLGRVDLARPEDLLALLYLGPDDVRELAHGAPRNTDDSMYVEFRGARDMSSATIRKEGDILARLERLASPIEDHLRDAASLSSPERTAALAAALERGGRPTARYGRVDVAGSAEAE